MSEPATPAAPEGERVAKLIARAGLCSRREAERLVVERRVAVDGRVLDSPAFNVRPGQRVTVDGKPLPAAEPVRLFRYHKPAGLLVAARDPEGRRTIYDALPEDLPRLMPIGRLDLNSEGLLLLTNDGELTNRLTHPSYEVPKTYLVQVRGPMAQGIGAQMKEGIELEDGLAQVDSFKLVDSTPGHVLVEVVLHSGRNRVVRRLFDAVGHPVERLVRTQLGPIRVGDQRQGSIRVLGRQEVGHLLASVGL